MSRDSPRLRRAATRVRPFQERKTSVRKSTPGLAWCKADSTGPSSTGPQPVRLAALSLEKENACQHCFWQSSSRSWHSASQSVDSACPSHALTQADSCSKHASIQRSPSMIGAPGARLHAANRQAAASTTRIIFRIAILLLRQSTKCAGIPGPSRTRYRSSLLDTPAELLTFFHGSRLSLA